MKLIKTIRYYSYDSIEELEAHHEEVNSDPSNNVLRHKDRTELTASFVSYNDSDAEVTDPIKEGPSNNKEKE